MASISELEAALVNADAAGDVDAAKTLAGEITRMRAMPTPSGDDGVGNLSVNNVARAAATGVPIIGGALNQMNAATNAALAPLLNPLFSEKNQLKGETFAERRAESLRQQESNDAAFAAKNPVIDTTAQIAGGIAGTIPAVMAAPAAFGAGTAGMGARSIASMISGGLIGGADSAVRSGGDLGSTATGGLVGGVTGVASPVMAAGAGKGVSYLADKIMGGSKPTGAISGLPKPAVKYALDAVDSAPTMQADLDRLGPLATLADVSPEWMGVARGAASRPGMRDGIVNRFLDRDAGKNFRLSDDLNTSLGPAPVPSRISATIEAGQRDLSPQYERVFINARPVNTQPIAEGLDADIVHLRGPAQRAAQQVRQMLNVAGDPENLDPSAYVLFQTRQAIDGLLTEETNPTVIRVLNRAREQVDETLTYAVPGVKDVDAQYAELARQNTAIGRGQQVLESGRTAPRPSELAEEVATGGLPQGTQTGPSAVPFRLRQGARAEIDRIQGTNANDPAAMQKLVKSEGDWNRDRLRTLFGPRADDALNAIDRETQFYRTSNRVTSGSDTAMANRFGDFIDAAATPSKIPTDTTLTGAGLRGTQKALQSMAGANAEAKAAEFAKDLGRMSVAQGAERDEIVRLLLGMATRRQSLEGIRGGSEGIARLLLQGGVRPYATRQLQE